MARLVFARSPNSSFRFFHLFFFSISKQLRQGPPFSLIRVEDTGITSREVVAGCTFSLLCWRGLISLAWQLNFRSRLRHLAKGYPLASCDDNTNNWVPVISVFAVDRCPLCVAIDTSRHGKAPLCVSSRQDRSHQTYITPRRCHKHLTMKFCDHAM